MENNSANLRDVCRYCGCNEGQATADAKAVGLEDEFHKGVYSCCQVVQWADEQWVAWEQAAMEDGKPSDQVTRPLEIGEQEAIFVPVRIRRPHDPS